MNLNDLAMNYDSKDVKRSYASVLTGTDTNLNQDTMIKDNDFGSSAEETMDPHQPTKKPKENMSNRYQVLSEDMDDEDNKDSTYFDPTNKPIPRSTAVMMAPGSTHTEKIDILPSFNPNKMIPDPTDFDPPITKLTRSHADHTSMMTQASCDEDGDEDHGMTTSGRPAPPPLHNVDDIDDDVDDPRTGSPFLPIIVPLIQRPMLQRCQRVQIVPILQRRRL